MPPQPKFVTGAGNKLISGYNHSGREIVITDIARLREHWLTAEKRSKERKTPEAREKNKVLAAVLKERYENAVKSLEV